MLELPESINVKQAVRDMQPQRIGAVTRFGLGRPDVIPLWLGEPDLPTPDFIKEAAIEALQAGETRYVDRRGIPELRAAIIDYVADLYGVALDADRVSCVGSGMTAIMIACQTLIDHGDNLVFVSPTWPNIFYTAQTLGGEARHVRLDNTDAGWKLDLDQLFAACDERTRAVFIASPSNPTGWVIDRDTQREILEFSRRRGIWIIADEVYHRIVYDGRTVPSFLQIAQPDDRLYVVHSMSKAWCMTGWRCGWLIHPSALATRMADLSGINNTGSTSFVQHGAAVAIRQGEPFIERLVQHCKNGRDLVYQTLGSDPRIEMHNPTAAFYSFFRVHGVEDDLTFAQRLVQEKKVGLAPGSAFGPGNEGYFRLCFANTPEQLSKAMGGLQEFLDTELGSA